MKIVFTGGGTGGHFYPLMAVAEDIRVIAIEKKLLSPELYYFANNPMSPNMLVERNIIYKYIPSGKMSGFIGSISAIFKLFFGIIWAFFKLLNIYPDVVFSKGGFDSVPTCIAAFILRIPIILHESDSVAGKANIFISRFAYKVAVSWQEATKYFDIKKTAWTGQPIITKYLPRIDFIKSLPPQRPNIFITGGSQGSTRVNDYILEILPEICAKYNIIHQVGENNIEDVKGRSNVILADYSQASYVCYGNVDFSGIYPYTDIVIGRSGSSLFEFAAWQLPTIFIPLPESGGNHQYSNAEICKRAGWAEIIEENNMSKAVLVNLIEKLLEVNNYKKMSGAALQFFVPNAARTIAEEIVNIALRHN